MGDYGEVPLIITTDIQNYYSRQWQNTQHDLHRHPSLNSLNDEINSLKFAPLYFIAAMVISVPHIIIADDIPYAGLSTNLRHVTTNVNLTHVM